jgi:hypothetical protein
MQSSRLTWIEHTACKVEMQGMYQILVEKNEKEKKHEKNKYKQVTNTEIYFQQN